MRTSTAASVPRKILAVLFCAALAISMVPSYAFAAGDGETSSEGWEPGTYTITANLMMPGEYNPLLTGIDVYSNVPTNPFGPTIDENDPDEVKSGIPSTAESMNAQLIVGEDGTKTLYLPIKNPIFTTQDLGTCEELPDVEVERVAPTHDVYNTGDWEGSYNACESRIHKALMTMTDTKTEGEAVYTFKGSELYAVPLNRYLQPDGDVALQLTVDYDTAERTSSSTEIPALETEKIVVNVPEKHTLPDTYVNKICVYATDAMSVKASGGGGSTVVEEGEYTGAAATGIGVRSAEIALVDADKYIWSDGSTEAKYYTWNVGVIFDPAVELLNRLEYSGEEYDIEQVLEPEGYTLSGQTKATDAGVYTAIATPKEGYSWLTGTTPTAPLEFSWNIQRVNVYPRVVETIKEGQTPSLDIAYYADDAPQGSSPVEAVKSDPDYVAPTVSIEYPENVSRPEDLPVGEYRLSIAGGNARNYLFLTPLAALLYPSTLTVEEAEAVAVPQGETPTYTGKSQTGIAKSEAYTVSGEAQAVVAGDYTATVTPNPGYKWEDGTRTAKQVEWSIEKAPLTATYAGEELAWGDTTSSPMVYSGFVNNEDETSATGFKAPVVSMPDTVEPNGSYTLTPSGGAADNYEFSYAPGTLKVLAAGTAPDPSAKQLVYTGEAQTGVAESVGYELTGASATEAGDYTATATLADGYTWQDGSTDDKTIPWSIAKAPLRATYAGETVTYGSDPSYAVEVEGFVGGEDADSASGYNPPTVQAPEKIAPNGTYELKPSGGSADNYSFTYIPGTLVVEALGEVEAPRAQSGLVYTGLQQDSGLVAPEHATLSGVTSATDAGTYEVEFVLDEGYVWSDGSIEPKSISWAIDRAVLTATYAGETMDVNGTFEGKVDVSGFVNGETAETAKGYIAPKVALPDDLKAGKTYELVSAGGSADNYVFAYEAGTLTVNADASAVQGNDEAADAKDGKATGTGDTLNVFGLAGLILAIGAASVAFAMRRRVE